MSGRPAVCTHATHLHLPRQAPRCSIISPEARRLTRAVLERLSAAGARAGSYYRARRRLHLAQSKLSKLASPVPTEWPRPPSEWHWDGGTISSS